MPLPCNNPLCSGDGHFEGDQCPGSEDSDCEFEYHHCVDCGDRSWTNKGSNCERCGDYWCINWQHVFIFPDCKHIECDEESICSKCFLADPSMWCSDAKCLCSCKQPEIEKKYLEFKAEGSTCGGMIMSNGKNFCNIQVNRYNGEARARTELIQNGKTIDWHFDSMDKAVAKASTLIKEKADEGYYKADPTSIWEKNPWGKLDGPLPIPISNTPNNATSSSNADQSPKRKRKAKQAKK